MRIQALSCSSQAQVDHRQRYHGAAMGTEAVRFLVLWMADWIHSRQLEVIDFLREENRVLWEQLGGRRLRFSDDQRRRLAVKGRIVGHCRLGEFAGAVRGWSARSVTSAIRSAATPSSARQARPPLARPQARTRPRQADAVEDVLARAPGHDRRRRGAVRQ